MATLTWLHLSDWHQGGGKFDRAVVLEALLEDIRHRRDIDDKLQKIDFIIFSGDLAFSGKAIEYNVATQQFLKPVLTAAGYADNEWDRLVIVPGNHDVDRERIADVPIDILKKLADREGVNDVLRTEWMRKAVLSPLENYIQFLLDILPRDRVKIRGDPGYYLVWSHEVDGKKIAFIGLNTAWLSGHNKDTGGNVQDYGHQILGEPQIYDPLLDCKNVDIRIAVMHHPLTWLVESDRLLVEQRLRRDCHFILHGHEHRPRIEVTSGTVGDIITIPAGASYDRRYPSSPEAANAYNIVHLDMDKLEGTVYLRRWIPERNIWDTDTETWTEGRYPFTLKKTPASSDQRLAQQYVFSRFVRALERRFCTRIDITMKQTLRDYGETELVRHEIRYQIKIPQGPKELFHIGNIGSKTVANLIDTNKVNIERPYELRYFRVNNKDIEPKRATKNGFEYAWQLDNDEHSIEYEFILYALPSDFYYVNIFRFTKYFKLSFQPDNKLEYAFQPIGGFPSRELGRRTPMDIYYVDAKWCHPGQGCIIEWYPSIGDQPSD